MDTDIDIETDKEIYVYTSIRFSGCGVACVTSEAKASECLFQSSNIPEFQLVLASCSLSTIPQGSKGPNNQVLGFRIVVM